MHHVQSWSIGNERNIEREERERDTEIYIYIYLYLFIYIYIIEREIQRNEREREIQQLEARFMRFFMSHFDLQLPWFCSTDSGFKLKPCTCATAR